MVKYIIMVCNDVIFTLLTGIMTSVSAKEIYRSKVRQMEELSRVLLPEASKRHGRRVEQCVAIYDMEGWYEG